MQGVRRHALIKTRDWRENLLPCPPRKICSKRFWRFCQRPDKLAVTSIPKYWGINDASADVTCNDFACKSYWFIFFRYNETMAKKVRRMFDIDNAQRTRDKLDDVDVDLWRWGNCPKVYEFLTQRRRCEMRSAKSALWPVDNVTIRAKSGRGMIGAPIRGVLDSPNFYLRIRPTDWERSRGESWSESQLLILNFKYVLLQLVLERKSPRRATSRLEIIPGRKGADPANRSRSIGGRGSTRKNLHISSIGFEKPGVSETNSVPAFRLKATSTKSTGT